jgi:hypothetical protein
MGDDEATDGRGMNDDEAAAWLPLGEASQRLGISVDALRARIRRGLIEHRKGNDHRVVVLVPAETPTGHGLNRDESALDRLRAELERARGEALKTLERATRAEAALAIAEAMAEERRALAEQLRAELGESRVNFARSEAERRAAQAVAVADVATARAEAEAAQKVIAVLEEQLRQARRPWWRRWLG